MDSSAISSIATPAITKCDSCNLSNEHELYDWELVDPDILETALHFNKELQSWKNNPKELKKKIFSINKGYITLRLDEMKNPSSIDNIRSLFKRALQKCDPTFIIEAYTTSQAFSKLLNIDMARIVTHDIKNGGSKFSCDILYTTQDGTKSIASILHHHRDWPEYSGKVYRGIVLPNELAHIQVGCCIMTNTFLSTSKNSDIADNYSGRDQYNQTSCQEDEKNVSIYCTYIIKNTAGNRRALDISKISKYSREEEVLLLPYSVFLITKRKTIERTNSTVKRIEIELEEYDERTISSTNAN